MKDQKTCSQHVFGKPFGPDTMIFRIKKRWFCKCYLCHRRKIFASTLRCLECKVFVHDSCMTSAKQHSHTQKSSTECSVHTAADMDGPRAPVDCVATSREGATVVAGPCSSADAQVATIAEVTQPAAAQAIPDIDEAFMNLKNVMQAIVELDSAIAAIAVSDAATGDHLRNDDGNVPAAIAVSDSATADRLEGDEMLTVSDISDPATKAADRLEDDDGNVPVAIATSDPATADHLQHDDGNVSVFIPISDPATADHLEGNGEEVPMVVALGELATATAGPLKDDGKETII